MPRKTRKQKVKARERAESTPSGSGKREFTFSFNEAISTSFISEPPKSSDLSRQTVDVSFVPSDLIKTLVLALGLFVLELVLYFVWFKR